MAEPCVLSLRLVRISDHGATCGLKDLADSLVDVSWPVLDGAVASQLPAGLVCDRLHMCTAGAHRDRSLFVHVGLVRCRESGFSSCLEHGYVPWVSHLCRPESNQGSLYFKV